MARLDIYDDAGTLLGSATTAVLAAGGIWNLALNRLASDIAYAVVAGDGTTVRLDNL